MTPKSLLILIVLNGLCSICVAQEAASSSGSIINFPDKFFGKVSEKATMLESKLDRQTKKYLQRLLRKEKKLKKQLQRTESASVAEMFGDIENQYASLITSSGPNNSSAMQYSPYFDTLKTSLLFFEKNRSLITSANNIQGKIAGSLQNLEGLRSEFGQAEHVKVFIRQRRDKIKQILSRHTKLPKGIARSYAGFNKELYYYSQQVQEYKELLNDPDKLTRKSLDLLSRTNVFQQFMREHSELAALFSMRSNTGTSQALAGLQTRAQVQQLVQAQLSGAGPNVQQVLQQNFQAAQEQLNTLKEKINKLGGGSSTDVDMKMPDFKKNDQKTKSFLQRLEIGTNLQSTKSNLYLPVTTDLGFSVGYKLNDKSILGFGGSYKVGWGKDIRHIVVTSQGAALRSFLDIKIRGTYYVSGGYEYNYQPAIAVAPYGQQNVDWTESGLLGFSKVISMKTKFFKRTKLQVLWDFLSYQQIPRTPALKFRVGYALR